MNLRKHNLSKLLNNYSHYKKIDHNLSIPGEAEKYVLVNPKNPQTRYIVKAPKKCGEVETITEYLINCIGMAIPGLNISKSIIGYVKVDPLKADSIYQTRFMSFIFHNEDERLAHGLQLFQNFYSEQELIRAEKRPEERNIYTVENIKSAIELLYSHSYKRIFLEFIDLCLFDALIGNQDRHAKNWGVLEPIRVSGIGKERFAPIFDTARGFLWNIPDEKLNKYLEKQQLVSYVLKCRPEISVVNNPKINHFELIRYLIGMDNEYASRIENLLKNMENIDIDSIFRQRVFIIGLSGLRRFLIKECFKLRLQKLKEVIAR